MRSWDGKRWSICWVELARMCAIVVYVAPRQQEELVEGSHERARKTDSSKSDAESEESACAQHHSWCMRRLSEERSVGFIRNTSMTVAARYVAMGAKAATALIVATTLGATGAGTFALVRILPHVAAGSPGSRGHHRRFPTWSAGGSMRRRRSPKPVALGLLLSAVGWTAWCFRARSCTPISTPSCPRVPCCSWVHDTPRAAAQLPQLDPAGPAAHSREQTWSCWRRNSENSSVVLPLLWVADSVSGTTLIVVAAVSGAAASCLTAVVLLLRHGIWPWPRLHWEIAVESIRFGLKGHVGRMANMLNWRLDTLILSTLASVEVVGYYAVASQVAEFFRPLSHSLSYVLRPLMASLSVAEARVRGVFLYRRVFMLNLALVLVMALVGGHVIVHVFGEEFASQFPLSRSC